MCGIFGLISGSAADREAFAGALNQLSHRGPDGESIWQDPSVVLGHRRLAIIDLSRDADQPMLDGEAGVALINNGEIYNYLEVRKVLEQKGVTFRTASDTEVLLKSYIEWGTGMFSYLNGMFAFAIYDSRKQTVLVARDRFGVKPFYYAFKGQAFAFGSEPKALIKLWGDLAEPDVQALYDLFVSSRSFAGASCFYENIRSLPPAHFAVLKIGDTALSPQRYWSYPDYDPGAAGRGGTEDEFRALFDDAARLRLRSDVPVGLALSGGLDSSAVLAAIANSANASIPCFTSVYSESERGEEGWARKAAALGHRELKSVVAEVDDWLGTLKKIVWHMDAPGYSPAVFPLWNIMKAARAAGVPVMLDGQGADELLAGYPKYFPYLSASLLGRTLRGKTAVSNFAAHLRGGVDTFGLKTTTQWHLRAAIEPLYRQMQARFGRGQFFAPDVIARYGHSSCDGRSQSGLHRDRLYAETLADHSNRVLPALLQYGDAVSMAHGIENRNPFMDYRLVEWVFKDQPPLMHNGKTKWLVRQYLEKMGYGEIARRTDKQGYPTPLVGWLGGEQARIRDEILEDRNARIWTLFDRSRAQKLFAQALRGDAASANHFYKIVGTHLWLASL